MPDIVYKRTVETEVNDPDGNTPFTNGDLSDFS